MHLDLRRATTDDSDFMWSLRNDPASRAASRDTDEISKEHHERWYEAALDDTNKMMFVIVGAGGKRVAYARFDLQGSEARISVAVDPARRGEGLGTEVIRLATEELWKRGGVDEIVADVREGNEASERAFLAAGYASSSSPDEGWVRLVRRRDN